MKKISLIFIPIIIAMVLSFVLKPGFSVTGTVKDTRGKPISFANVSVKGTSLRTTTDKKGGFSISVANENEILLFSAVGYVSREVQVNKNHVVHVVLQQTQRELQEVVVTGMAKKSIRKERHSRMPQSVVANGFYSDDKDHNTEDYSNIAENGFHNAINDPLSTFSIDVDAASYSNVRRFLNSSQLPPAGAVRIEEMINYFKYNYPAPSNGHPFSINTEMSECPWNSRNKLLLIGLQGKQIPVDDLPAANLVFLVDVSGSMSAENKLPLVKQSLNMLTDQLREEDKISIVVYAGNAGLVLPATGGDKKGKIRSAINDLEAGGSTAGGAGIKLAYQIAKQNFQEDGNNRVILCTDGDFNVGASSDDDMVRLIEKERESGVFLTVLGYGMGNYKDNKMQQLADKGNGNHAYIDGLNEAKKVLVTEFGGTIFTIAKDVKLQVEFNPSEVAGYRLIGYENRILNKEDFRDDKKDAGELGSGHTVTALYEIVPAGVKSDFMKEIDVLKYQQPKIKGSTPASGEYLTIKFRYKDPAGDKSKLLSHVVSGDTKAFDQTTSDFRFAATVAGFGMLLRNSEFKGDCTFSKLLQHGTASIGTDKEGYRKEFIALVKKADKLSGKISDSGEE